MGAGREVLVQHEGRELRVADLGEAWRVRVGGRTAEAPFLDKALADLLQLDTASAVALARRVLEARDAGSDAA